MFRSMPIAGLGWSRPSSRPTPDPARWSRGGGTAAAFVTPVACCMHGRSRRSRVIGSIAHHTVQVTDSRHVRAIPWPSGRWRARRRIDTGHAGRLHSRKRARGHVHPRCCGGGSVGRGKGCRHRHRSDGGQPASRDDHGRSCSPASHLRTAEGAADTAHGRAGGTDRCATGRLQPRRSMASENAYEPPLQKLARRHDQPRVIVGGSIPRSRRARSPRATRGGGGGQGGRRPVTPVAGQSFSAT